MIELFSPPISVLGTLAASYLCVAVIVKYYLMDNHTVIITPEHSQGSVTLFLIDTCVFTICYLFYPVALCALLMCVYVVCVCVCCVCVCVVCVFQRWFVGFNVQCRADHLLWLPGRIRLCDIHSRSGLTGR